MDFEGILTMPWFELSWVRITYTLAGAGIAGSDEESEMEEVYNKPAWIKR
jgi:hypothetical protein